MTRTIAPDAACLTWAGAVSLQVTEAWAMPWRIPYAQRQLFDWPTQRITHSFLDRAAMSSGVRLAFCSNTKTVGGAIIPGEVADRLDLCIDDAFFASQSIHQQDSFQFEGLPEGDKRIESWLPQAGSFRLKWLAVDSDAEVHAFDDSRPTWVTYGSSITQCAGVESPTQTWPALVARKHNLNLTCLGYGSQCHADSMIARMMRDMPADFLSICVGINVYSVNSLNERSLRAAIIGFVQIVREKHPDSPFVVMSPLLSVPLEDTPNTVGFTLQAMRMEIEEAVGAVQAAMGDPNLHYVNGLDIMGHNESHLMPDGVHPSAEGYKVMAERFSERVVSVWFSPSD